MISCIKKLLLKEYWKDASHNAKLKDSDSGMMVDITGLPEDSLVITIPPGGKIHLGIMKDLPKLRQSCDNLILVNRDDCVDAYFIELKKSLEIDEFTIRAKPFEQILHTTPAWDYLVSVVRVHFQKQQRINQFFVVIGEEFLPRLDKQSMKKYSLKKITHKDKEFIVIAPAQIIPFRHLR